MCPIPGLLKSYVLRKSCYSLIILLFAVQNWPIQREKGGEIHSRFKCAKVNEIFLGSPLLTLLALSTNTALMNSRPDNPLKKQTLQSLYHTGSSIHRK